MIRESKMANPKIMSFALYPKKFRALKFFSRKHCECCGPRHVERGSVTEFRKSHKGLMTETRQSFSALYFKSELKFSREIKYLKRPYLLATTLFRYIYTSYLRLLALYKSSYWFPALPNSLLEICWWIRVSSAMLPKYGLTKLQLW